MNPFIKPANHPSTAAVRAATQLATRNAMRALKPPHTPAQVSQSERSVSGSKADAPTASPSTVRMSKTMRPETPAATETILPATEEPVETPTRSATSDTTGGVSELPGTGGSPG